MIKACMSVVANGRRSFPLLYGRLRECDTPFEDVRMADRGKEELFTPSPPPVGTLHRASAVLIWCFVSSDCQLHFFLINREHIVVDSKRKACHTP